MHVSSRVPDDVSFIYETPVLDDEPLMHLCLIPSVSEPVGPTDKVQVQIRLDEDVLAWFKSRAFVLKNGGSFCQLINDALRTYASDYGNQKL